MCVCANVCGSTCWGEQLWGVTLFFYHVGPRAETQVVMFGARQRFLLSPLAGLCLAFQVIKLFFYYYLFLYLVCVLNLVTSWNIYIYIHMCIYVHTYIFTFPYLEGIWEQIRKVTLCAAVGMRSRGSSGSIGLGSGPLGPGCGLGHFWIYYTYKKEINNEGCQTPVKRTPPSSRVFLFSSRAMSWILLEAELEKGSTEPGISFRFLWGGFYYPRFQPTERKWGCLKLSLRPCHIKLSKMGREKH